MKRYKTMSVFRRAYMTEKKKIFITDEDETNGTKKKKIKIYNIKSDTKKN